MSLSSVTFHRFFSAILLTVIGPWPGLAWGAQTQKTTDQAALMLLASARQAYNEKNPSVAEGRFREFLLKHGAHKEAASARFGLALALLAGPKKNYNEIRDLLRAAAANTNLPEHPHAVYHLGLVLRRLGLEELTIADAKPPELPQRLQTARQRFEEARQQFAQTMTEFLAKSDSKAAAGADKLSASLEWAARARCDQAELLLRLEKAKEAKELTAGFLDDPVLTRSHCRDLGRYYYGFAAFLLKDIHTAGKTLSTLAPFSDPFFGVHARYLVARVHHLVNDRAEARLQYEKVQSAYAENKKTAAALLAEPTQLHGDVWEQERLERLVMSPPPNEVVRAGFYLCELLCQERKFAEARECLTEFLKLHPKSALRPDAELQLGLCLVQLKDSAGAIKILTALVGKERRLADQVMFWLGKAQLGSAPDAAKDGPGRQKALIQALTSYRQAADAAQQLIATDTEARARRGDILLELADAQQLLNQFKEAAATFNQVINEKSLPQQEEEILLRQIAALHRAGDFNESDKVCAVFLQKFPQSTSLSAIFFRQAENSYFHALAAEKANNPKELVLLRDEAIKRYERILEKFPEDPRINLARYGLGLVHYRKGAWSKAVEELKRIPPAERKEELDDVPYVLADCFLRLAAGEGDSEAGKTKEQLETAAELLEGFVKNQPEGPHAADALLKLGLCRQRLARLAEQPAARARLLASAREAYENIVDRFANDPLQPQAILERARCMTQMNDVNGAVAELQRFTDALKNTPIAPLAVVELATLLRGENRAPEAAAVLAKAREQHEAALARDPRKAVWVALLRYHQGLALRQAGKLPEARSIFDLLLKQAPNQPEAAEAALRFAECLTEEAQPKIELGHKSLASAKKPEETNQAQKLLGDGYKAIGDAAQFLEGQAEQWRQKPPTVFADLEQKARADRARARMLYDAAWGYRCLAERDITAARAVKAQELMKKLGPGAKLALSDIPLAAVPVQASETKVRALCEALVQGFPDSPLSNQARFELAELHVERHEYDLALKLLNDGLGRESPAKLADQIRLRLGEVHAARGDRQAALTQFNAVAQNSRSPLLAQALYRSGEYLMQEKQWAESIRRLAKFRDEEALKSVPGLSDRALLALGRAYAQVQEWNESRKANEQLMTRFPESPLFAQARYEIGSAWQGQREYDQAVDAYKPLLAEPSTVMTAKAQLQIGLCRLAQQRYPEAASAFLVVPIIYDDPELSAGALLEAARAFAGMNQREQAVRLLQRVLRDYPQSVWAEAARARLQELTARKK